MFCYQCEQTARGTGCNMKMGVCGKTDETAVLQDVLVYVTKGLSQYAHRARQKGAVDAEIDRFMLEALFTTVTNVDFDPERIVQYIHKGVEMRDKARNLYQDAAGADAEQPAGPAQAEIPDTKQALVEFGRKISIENRKADLGEVVTGLQEMITYGLKGAAAYSDHAHILGQEDKDLYGRFHAKLSWLAEQPTDVEKLVAEALDTGSINLRAMELLDAGNTGLFGHPEPTEVRVTPVKGKCIVVSGHDLKDLETLLKQTEGKGINVYTHGEMLPCLAYPELKKYKHLVGNYGGAWQDQQKEFDEFPGAIVMTTNCIQKPRDSYKDRIFTTGLVAWPGVTHIEDRDFTPAIEAALAQPGFEEDAEEKTIMVGFGRNAVMNVAGTVVEAVKAGKIRHFFLVGGCDGAKPGRNYYTEFTQAVPDDCVILTLACGKYRFNKLPFGDIGGIPRLLDVGQCNDAYSAIQIALALAEAFECEVNELPLTLVLSWYEQKAVAILLTLLHLGIKNMRLGPTLPAFVTEPVLEALVENYAIAPVTEPQADLEAILA